MRCVYFGVLGAGQIAGQMPFICPENPKTGPEGPFFTLRAKTPKKAPPYGIRIFWGRCFLPHFICPLPRPYRIRLKMKRGRGADIFLYFI